MLVNSWQKRLPSRRWDSMLNRWRREVNAGPFTQYHIRQTFAVCSELAHLISAVLPLQPLKTSRLLLNKYLTKFHNVASAGLWVSDHHRTILFLLSWPGFQDMLSQVFEVKSSTSIELFLFVYILFYLKPLGANSLFLFSPEYFYQAATHQRWFTSERTAQTTRDSAARKICRTNNSIDNRDGGVSLYLPSAPSRLDGTAHETQWRIPWEREHRVIVFCELSIFIDFIHRARNLLSLLANGRSKVLSLSGNSSINCLE